MLHVRRRSWIAIYIKDQRIEAEGIGSRICAPDEALRRRLLIAGRAIDLT